MIRHTNSRLTALPFQRNNTQCFPAIPSYSLSLHFFYVLLFITFLGQPTIATSAQINLPKDSQGWTVFTPSSDSRIVYISANGNDSTGQHYNTSDTTLGGDPFNPSGEVHSYATYSAAYAQTRDGYPDWILFKRGDTFFFSIGGVKSGRSETEPFFVGAYGATGPLPLLKHGSSFGLSVSKTSPSVASESKFFAISSLRFYAHTRDPENTSEYAGPAGNLGLKLNAYSTGNSINSCLIEGCEFIYEMNNGVTADGGGTVYDVKLRRNKFLSNYPDTSHSQGLWANKVDGFFLEENIFDHNGWYSKNGENGIGPGTVFNHNIYFAGVKNTTLKNNVFMRGSNMNNKFTSPYGDSENITIDGNLYVGGHIGIGIGTNYLNTADRFKNVAISNNVMTNLGMDNVTGQGIAWYMQISGWKEGTVSGNILMNQIGELSPNGTHAFEVWSDARDVNITGNVVYNLEDSSTYMLYANSSTATYNFSNNKISILNGNPKLTLIKTGPNQHSNNKWHSSTGGSSGWVINGADNSFLNFAASIGDTSSTYGSISFPDPTRSIETYMRSLGADATIDAFIVAARAQNRYSWNSQFTANAVNTWIKKGFLNDISSPAGFRKISGN